MDPPKGYCISIDGVLPIYCLSLGVAPLKWFLRFLRANVTNCLLMHRCIYIKLHIQQQILQ